eukprot:7497177-Pyramimonas_sp.AAC.1
MCIRDRGICPAALKRAACGSPRRSRRAPTSAEPRRRTTRAPPEGRTISCTASATCPCCAKDARGSRRSPRRGCRPSAHGRAIFRH